MKLLPTAIFIADNTETESAVAETVPKSVETESLDDIAVDVTKSKLDLNTVCANSLKDQNCKIQNTLVANNNGSNLISYIKENLLGDEIPSKKPENIIQKPNYDANFNTIENNYCKSNSSVSNISVDKKHFNINLFAPEHGRPKITPADLMTSKVLQKKLQTDEKESITNVKNDNKSFNEFVQNVDLYFGSSRLGEFV